MTLIRLSPVPSSTKWRYKLLKKGGGKTKSEKEAEMAVALKYGYVLRLKELRKFRKDIK